MNLCHGKKMISFFKAVCDWNRHVILHLIKKNGEMNASNIVDKVNLAQPTVSHHLKILVDAGVLVSRKTGKEIYYKINKEFINHCCRDFADDVCSKNCSQ